MAKSAQRRGDKISAANGGAAAALQRA